MVDRFNVLAAKWIFDKAGKTFPEGEITRVYLDTETGGGGYCETCAYSYSYFSARVYIGDEHHYAEYDPGWTVDLSDILEGMAEYDTSTS